MKIITNAPVLDKENGKSTIISKGKPFGGYRDLIEYTDGDTGESIYWSADGDEYYNAKGQKVNIFKAIGKGIGKGAKGVVKGVKWLGKEIIKAERWVVKKTKNLAKGTKKAGKGSKVKSGKKALIHSTTSPKGGEDKFIGALPQATASTPKEKIVVIEGQKLSAVDIPANKPLIVATDPSTGKKSVGVEYKANEVVGVENIDGTYDYHPTADVEESSTSKMSNLMKIGLVVGGIAVIGVIIYFIAKKKK